MSFVFRSPLISGVKIADCIHKSFCHPNLIEIADQTFIVDIPKSGSSFLKSSLIAAGRSSFSFSPRLPHTALFSRPLRCQELFESKIFAFVRDPIDRFCSVVREKIMQSSLHAHGWSPYLFSFGRQFYDCTAIDAMVNEFTTSPFWLLDKHILPQAYFWSPFLSLPGFQLLPLSSMNDFLCSSGIDSVFFPDTRVSLKTVKSDFCSSDLSDLSVGRLSSFYRSDLCALKVSQSSTPGF